MKEVEPLDNVLLLNHIFLKPFLQFVWASVQQLQVISTGYEEGSWQVVVHIVVYLTPHN